MRTHATIIGLLALLVGPSPLVAQRGMELGADLGLGVQFYQGGGSVFQVTVPTAFRAGFPVGSSASFEPRVAFQLASGGGSTATNLDITAAGLIGFGGSQGSSRPYFAILPEFSHVSVSGGSASQFGLGAGVGVRMIRSERFGPRLELQYMHGFENDNFNSTNSINALIGFSFFTH